MTSRFRRGRGQQPQNYGMPQVIPCPSCGMLNDPSARFCRNCGLPLGWPQDPVRGTMMRQADLPSERGAGIASIVGLVAAVAILGAAGYLVLRGTNGNNPSPTPPVTATATATPTATATAVAIGSGSPSPRPTGTPVAVISPSPTPTFVAPTPTEIPSGPVGTPPPAAKNFTCTPVTIANSVKGHWVINQAHWSYTSKYDTITLDMTLSKGGGFPSMTMESMDLNDVSSQLGLTPPTGTDHAVVVTLGKPFSSIRVSPHDTKLDSLNGEAMTAVPTFQIQFGTDDLWHVVLGVNGSGCQRIGVAEWAADPNATSAHIVIDVQH